MTPAQIIELRNYIAADATLKTLANAGSDQQVADTINGRTATVIEPRMITSRGIASALGSIDGENFLKVLENFSVATLDPANPLLPYQPGIKRQIAWLSTDGLDLGDKETRSLMDALAAAAIITTSWATTLKAVAQKTVSYPVSVGWGMLTANNIAWAVRDASGNTLLGA